MQECDRCRKQDHLLELVRNNEESEMLCHSCWGYIDAMADIEYDRQREEGENAPTGIPSNKTI
jgi:hypothetical protein